MAKMTSWQAPLVVRRFKTPTGPLVDVDSGMVYDFTRQRTINPKVIGARDGQDHTMNQGGGAADAILTSPETHGTESPFCFPK